MPKPIRPERVTSAMSRCLIFLALLSFGCDAIPPPAAPPEPPRSAPTAPPVAPPPRQLSEAELQAVLGPAWAALEAADLRPLPITLSDPDADGLVYDRLVDLLLAHLRVTRVRVGAHTDPRGSAEYNERISQERAEAVARALIERGIGCTRIEAVGFGESRPLADAPPSAQRRIELEFVRVDETAVEPLSEDACGLSSPERPQARSPFVD